MKPQTVTLLTASTSEEYSLCAEIWLAASVCAHNFIPRSFWENNLLSMKERYLPASYVRMAVVKDTIAGFSALNGTTLEALFVLPEHWSTGLGTALLTDVLCATPMVDLFVYEKNKRAASFYARMGFRPAEARICPYTGEREINMVSSGLVVRQEEKDPALPYPT